MLAVPPERLQQALELTTGDQQVLAAEWLKNALADAAAGFADALDEIEVAVVAGDPLDDEQATALRFPCG